MQEKENKTFGKDKRNNQKIKNNFELTG